MSIRVVTDSTCDLPAAVVAQLAIRVMPLYIHVGNQAYLDGIDMTRDEFYQKLPGFREHPTTAVPSGEKFRAIYNGLAEEGATDILSIHISETLSGTVNVARSAAAETTSARVHVIDSRQLSMGTGFLVKTAAEMAHAGEALNHILAGLENQVKRTHVWAALDTLKFLRRSGRMNAAISTIGELIQLKPILTMYDGVTKAERVRTRAKAIELLVKKLREFSPFEEVAFLHSEALEQAHALRDQVLDLLPDRKVFFEVITPVLGAHIGPGVVGFACISKA